MERTYTVVLVKEEDGGYSVTVPALPGCFTQGATVPEALERVREAIVCHLKALQADGERIPADVDTVVFDWGGAAEALAYKVRVPEAVPAA
jgi:predicted RNase H-like HicB family nuclease